MPLVSNMVRFFGGVGGYAIARQMTKRQPKILMYHRFSDSKKSGYTSKESFKSHLAYLRKYHQVIPLSDLAVCIRDGKTLPENAVVLTVDDGYQDFYSVAFPVLKEFGMPATLFATTGFIDNKLWLWPDKITYLLKQKKALKEKICLGDASLSPDDVNNMSYDHIWRLCISSLLSVPEVEKQDAINRLADAFGVNLPDLPPIEYQACSWSELNEMQNDGIQIGGHTVTHPSLGQVSSEQAYVEINDAKNSLNLNLGERSRSFCYPNGTRNDYSDDIERMVEEAGYDCSVVAFSDFRGVEQLYALRRHAVCDDNFQFLKSVSGIELLGKIIRNNPKTLLSLR